MKLGVIGLGLIGGSMALDLKASGFASEVLGLDHSKAHEEAALKLNLVDRIVSLNDLCKADLIILAIPVNVLGALLPTVLDMISPSTSVTDVGSTKTKICELVSNHKNRKQFVPSHPMAGTEFSGPQAAFKGLFENKAAVICDEEQSDHRHVTRIKEMYEALKMRVISMNSKDHDLHAAYVSHLSHISSFVLANTVLDKEKDVNAIFNLASAGFESTVRLAKSSPDMWAPIFDQNNQFILEALSAYIERLEVFHSLLKNKDFEGTKKLMRESNEIRRVLAKISNKGTSHG